MDDQSLGGWIKREREQRGWTQLDLSKRVGTDPGTVSRWERLKVKPELSQLAKLCEVFETSPADVLPLYGLDASISGEVRR